MTQEGPFPFRDNDQCACRRRCADRVPSGKFLWIVAPDAIGVWASMTEPRKLAIVPDVLSSCNWEVRYEGGTGPEIGIECVIELSYGKELGPGVPYWWFARMTFEVQGTGFAGDFIAEWADVFTESTTCRMTPDFTPAIIAEPINPFWPPGQTVGEVLTLWGGGRSPF